MRGSFMIALTAFCADVACGHGAVVSDVAGMKKLASNRKLKGHLRLRTFLPLLILALKVLTDQSSLRLPTMFLKALYRQPLAAEPSPPVEPERQQPRRFLCLRNPQPLLPSRLLI